MSQEFKLKFEQMKDGDPTPPQETGDAIKYPNTSHARNLGFVWPSGRKLFLNYAYLVCCDYDPDSNTVDLLFTTHRVKLKGFYLKLLYEELMEQLPKEIICTQDRYNVLEAGQIPVVNEIFITEK